MKKYDSITDVYNDNARVREHLLTIIDSIPDDKAAELPVGETWTLQQIVEHIAIVDRGVAGICSRLAEKARSEARLANGAPLARKSTMEKWASAADSKFEAPERVEPVGNVPIASSVALLNETKETFARLLPQLETYDFSSHTFPHPYFGEMTASEWLIVAGGHEMRHTEQIKRRLA